MKHAFKFTLNMGVYDGKCANCGQDYRVKVTTQCPEGKLCEDIAKRVQAGKLDFKDGAWISLNSEQEEKSSMKFVDSLSDFLRSLESEFSPEATDELTDEDINLLKNINSVPLPVVCVNRLELPVDQLVSLHKLKRLRYVFISKEAQQYRISDKGAELLSPKPVKLNADQLVLLLSVLVDEKPWTAHDVVELQVCKEMEYLHDLGLVDVLDHVCVVTDAGLTHTNKILALTV